MSKFVALVRASIWAFGVFAMSACAPAPPGAGEGETESESARSGDEGSITDFLSVNPAYKWPTSTIGVCWEDFDQSTETDRRLVEQAVRATWEAHSSIRFGNRDGESWIECTPRSAGIRIGVADLGPRTLGLGTALNGKANGMLLNFVLQAWRPDCPPGRDLCIQSIAVHEFGHALGFHHEQNRPEAPGECALLRSGSTPVLLLTPYDPDSVMNYCNIRPNNNAVLSERDIAGLRTAYPL